MGSSIFDLRLDSGPPRDCDRRGRECGNRQSKSKIANLLGSCGGTLLLALVPVVFALELFNAASGVDVLHFAGKEGMAGGTDFDRNVFARAARHEFVATATGYGSFHVFGVNAGFHGIPHFVFEKCILGGSCPARQERYAA